MNVGSCMQYSTSSIETSAIDVKPLYIAEEVEQKWRKHSCQYQNKIDKEQAEIRNLWVEKQQLHQLLDPKIFVPALSQEVISSLKFNKQTSKPDYGQFCQNSRKATSVLSEEV